MWLHYPGGEHCGVVYNVSLSNCSLQCGKRSSDSTTGWLGDITIIINTKAE